MALDALSGDGLSESDDLGLQPLDAGAQVGRAFDDDLRELLHQAEQPKRPSSYE